MLLEPRGGATRIYARKPGPTPANTENSARARLGPFCSVIPMLNGRRSRRSGPANRCASR
jgi:hypothetical protein